MKLAPIWASDIDIDLDPTDDPMVDLDNFFEIDHKMGYDVGVIFGYDAGIVRAELDLSYKRATHDEYEFDDRRASPPLSMPTATPATSRS